MHITPEQVVQIKEILHQDGLIGPPPEDGYSEDWDQEAQAGFDAYLRNHEGDYASQMLGQQPGVIEALGKTLQHALDEGVSLALAAERRVLGWLTHAEEKVAEQVKKSTKRTSQVEPDSKTSDPGQSDQTGPQAAKDAEDAEVAARAQDDLQRVKAADAAAQAAKDAEAKTATKGVTIDRTSTGKKA